MDSRSIFSNIIFSSLRTNFDAKFETRRIAKTKFTSKYFYLLHFRSPLIKILFRAQNRERYIRACINSSGYCTPVSPSSTDRNSCTRIYRPRYAYYARAKFTSDLTLLEPIEKEKSIKNAKSTVGLLSGLLRYLRIRED